MAYTFYLNFDTWRPSSKWIGISDNINATILTSRRNPPNVVPHSTKEVSDQFLEFIRIHTAQILFDFSPGLLFCLLVGDAYRLVLHSGGTILWYCMFGRLAGLSRFPLVV